VKSFSPERNEAQRSPVLGHTFARLLLAVLFAFLCGNTFGQQPSTNAANIRFAAVDIFLDSPDKPLAAYQLEFAITNGLAKIVGIEGGEHPAFREPPFYDPKAMQSERVVIAAFSTGKQLPIGKTRVATIHLQVTGTAEPQIHSGQEITVDSSGEKLPVKTSLEMRVKK
jgi:hypothetical protein